MSRTENAVTRAVKRLGGFAAVGRALEVTPQAVEYWCRTGQVPARRLKPFIALLDAAGAVVAPEQLNPHVVIV